MVTSALCMLLDDSVTLTSKLSRLEGNAIVIFYLLSGSILHLKTVFTYFKLLFLHFGFEWLPLDRGRRAVSPHFQSLC